MRRSRRLLSLVAAATAALTPLAAAAPAQADAPLANIFTPSLDPVGGAGGGVDCHGGDACVKQVGDTARVDMTVRISPLLLSTDQSLMATAGAIFVPSTLRNVSFTLVSAPTSPTPFDKAAAFWQAHPDLSRGVVDPMTPTIRGLTFDTVALNKPIPVFQPGAPTLSDGPAWLSSGTPSLPENFGVARYQSTGGAWPAAAPVQEFTPGDEAYDQYGFVMPDAGVYEVRVQGDIRTQSDLTVLPIRATNKTFRCYLEECASLSTLDWAKNGPLPHYSLTDSATNAALNALNTADGLGGATACRVTKNAAASPAISGDVTPASADVANTVSTGGWSNPPATWPLHYNPAVTYIVSDHGEDGCDQAAFVVTVCADPIPTPTTAVGGGVASATPTSTTGGQGSGGGTGLASGSPTAGGNATPNGDAAGQSGLSNTGAAWMPMAMTLAAVALLAAGASFGIARRRRTAPDAGNTE